MAAARLNRRSLLKLLALEALLDAAPAPHSGFAATTGSKPTRIKTVSLSSNSNKVFDQLLMQQGFLAEFGVEPEAIYVSDGSKVVAALVSGAADVCMEVGFPSVIPAILHGAKIKVVAAAENYPETAVYSAKPEIKSAKDLVGRTVGVGALGALLHLLMVALLQKKGVDVSKVNFVNVGSSTDVFRAVVSGRVDAGPGDNAFYETSERYGVHPLADGALWKELPDFLNQVSLSTDVAISQHGEGIVRLLAAYRRLYQFIQGPTSQGAWRSAFAKALNSPVTEADSQWRYYQANHPFAENLIVEPDRIRYIQQLNMSLGFQTEPLALDQIVDSRLAQKALILAR